MPVLHRLFQERRKHMALPVVMSAMLGAIAFMAADSVDAPPALFGGGRTTKVEAAQPRQRKQERRRQERRRNTSPAKSGNTTAILGLCSFSCTATSRHGSGRAALRTRVAVRSAIC